MIFEKQSRLNDVEYNLLHIVGVDIGILTRKMYYKVGVLKGDIAN